MKETIRLAEKIFKRNKETENYIPDYENDLAVYIDGFIFVIQAKNGFNNVIFAKVHNPLRTLRSVFNDFRIFCLFHKLSFIRIEGNKRRYGFLSLMFPACSFVKEENSERNIFYIKLD